MEEEQNHDKTIINVNNKALKQSFMTILMEWYNTPNTKPILPEFKLYSFRPTPEEVQKSWPGNFSHLLTRYYNLDNLGYAEVCQLETDFIDFVNYYCRRMGIHFYQGPGPYGENIREVSDKKKELGIQQDQMAALFYSVESNVVMYYEEEVNGYHLWTIKDNGNIMSYEDFLTLRKKSDIYIPDEEFLQWLDDNCCSDWAKQDRDGECYGGFWQYPEGSYEKENAYTLSREDNFKGLCELPYPRELIKETIKMGCSNRQESVRYSNFICEWIKRKAALMYKFPSLKTLSSAVVKTQVKYNEKELPKDIIDLLK